MKRMCLLSCVVVFGLVSLAQEIISLTFLTPLSGADGAFMDAIVAKFNEEYPSIKVTHLVIGASVDYKTKVSTGIATGTCPEILFIRKFDMPDFLPYFHAFTISELQQYGIDINDVYPQFLEGLIKDGCVYGIPLDCWIWYMPYNRAHFKAVGLDPDKPPRDRESFFQALETLKAVHDPNAGSYPIITVGPSWNWEWMNWVWQFGGDLLSPDWKSAAFEEAGIKAAQFMLEQVDRGYRAPFTANADQSLCIGLSSLFITGVWTVGTFEQCLAEDFGAAPVPQVGTTPAVFSGSHVLALPEVMVKDQKIYSAAMTFVRYLWEHAIDWYAAGQCPARKSIAESIELRERLPNIYVIAQQLPIAKQWPMMPIISEIMAEIQVYLDKALLTRELPIEVAIKEAVKTVNEMLEDYWGS